MCLRVYVHVWRVSCKTCKNVVVPSCHIIHSKAIKSRFTFNYPMLNDSQASPLGGWHRWHPSNILPCISPLQPLCSKYLEQLAQDWSLSRVYELTFCYNSIPYNPTAVFFFSIFSSERLCLIIQASSLVPPIQRLVWWIRSEEEPQELRGNKGAGGNRFYHKSLNRI